LRNSLLAFDAGTLPVAILKSFSGWKFQLQVTRSLWIFMGMSDENHSTSSLHNQQR